MPLPLYTTPRNLLLPFSTFRRHEAPPPSAEDYAGISRGCARGHSCWVASSTRTPPPILRVLRLAQHLLLNFLDPSLLCSCTAQILPATTPTAASFASPACFYTPRQSRSHPNCSGHPYPLARAQQQATAYRTPVASAQASTGKRPRTRRAPASLFPKLSHALASPIFFCPANRHTTTPPIQLDATPLTARPMLATSSDFSRLT
ncbi:hypothetical protein DFH27DRAFT_611983 [Peziza echinospora]|nr:hypothetical protein DFH27DRAFT_611983 [Peziza echinospora]